MSYEILWNAHNITQPSNSRINKRNMFYHLWI